MAEGAGSVRRQLEYLINGFDFYGHREGLARDDLRVRTRASEALAQALSQLRAWEGQCRSRWLPPPSRAQPLPDAAALARLRELEELAAALQAAESLTRGAPLVHTDRAWERLRSSTTLLELLLEHDLGLIREADAVAAQVAALPDVPPSPAAVDLSGLRAALQRLQQAFAARQRELQSACS